MVALEGRWAWAYERAVWMRWAVVGRAGDTTTRVFLKVEERRRERRAGFGEGELSGSVDCAVEREEEDEREGEWGNGEMYGRGQAVQGLQNLDPSWKTRDGKLGIGGSAHRGGDGNELAILRER